MQLKTIIPILAAALLAGGCTHSATQTTGGGEQATDSVQAAPEALAPDSALTATARYYADKVDSRAAYNRMALVDSIVSRDMSDMQEKCNFAFYPFGGPDFLFVHHLFPKADTYFLMGLEKLGSISNTPSQGKVEAYTQALGYYFAQSYYITKNMAEEMHNDDVDGVLPIITMLMVKDNCQIISVNYKDIDSLGNIVDAASDRKAQLAQVKFMSNDAPTREKTLYFYSGNIDDKHFDDGLKAYLDRTLPQHKVATFLKAASYLMHYSSFSTIRRYVLDNSFAVLQDDSGIPYKEFPPEKWSFQLYGKFRPPLQEFPVSEQDDLSQAYAEQADKVRPLTFRIGYTHPSNWMIARKK